jgi:protein TonB
VILSRPLPAIPFAARVRHLDGRRTLGLGLAIFIEVLLLLLLLTLDWGNQAPEIEKQRPTVVTFITPQVSEEPPESHRSEAQRDQQSARPPQPPQPQPDRPQPPQPPQPAQPPAQTVAPPPPPAIVPSNWSLTPSAPHPPAASATPVYGPVNRPSVMASDTERVGTAPNGQPLYAASWYREPDHAMMRAYLSSAQGPGWGLIACRTAPDFRVEDCVGLGEYPEGSQIMRSALAAAWEFRVRPPRLGGRVLVGAWVRIRISYN